MRFSKDSGPPRRAEYVNIEVRLLAEVSGTFPFPVPVPAFADAEEGCLACFKLPGLPLLDVPQHTRMVHAASIGAELAMLMPAMHSAPIDQMADLVDRDDTSPAEWLREAAEIYPAIAEKLPAAHRRPMEVFLVASQPPHGGNSLAFSHNDLGIEHVLVDPSALTITGIIDWSDAAIVDPSYDFGLLYRDLGPAALEAAIGSYRTDVADVPELRQRAVFYAKPRVFEDLAYGLETGQRRYVDKGITALEWLFPV